MDTPIASVDRDALILQFASEARTYCRFIENHSALTHATFLARAVYLLSSLYRSASLLPELVLSVDEPLLTETDAVDLALRRSLSEKLGVSRFYGSTDLSDDLSDIYHDIKIGLHILDTSEADMLYIVADHWRDTFAYHWGNHLVNALTGLHHLRYGEQN